MNQHQNPPPRAFDDMTDEERIAHIDKHTFIAETAIEIFELTTRHKIHLVADKYWGDSICYIARYRWMKTYFTVDRRLPLAAQSALLQRALGRTMAEYHSELLDRELKLILNQNDARKA